MGFTAYTVHVNVVRRMAERVKERNPGTFVVVGGHHATVAHADFVSPDIDVIVLGEGTAPFAEIVRRIERGEGFEGIGGTRHARLSAAPAGCSASTEPPIVRF